MKTAVLNSIEQAYVLKQEVEAILATGNDCVIKPSKCKQYYYLSAGKANKNFACSSILKDAKTLITAIQLHMVNKVTISQSCHNACYDIRG